MKNTFTLLLLFVLGSLTAQAQGFDPICVLSSNLGQDGLMSAEDKAVLKGLVDTLREDSAMKVRIIYDENSQGIDDANNRYAHIKAVYISEWLMDEGVKDKQIIDVAPIIDYNIDYTTQERTIYIVEGDIAVPQSIERRVVLSEIEQRRQNRGLVQMNNAFVPKGQWITGASASYSTHINDNYNFYIITDIVSDGYSVKAAPVVAYAIKDNFTIGARMEYGRTLLRIDNVSLDIESDDSAGINITIYDIYSLSQSFQGFLSARQYIPLGESKRFALFSELRLGLGGSRSKYAFDSPVQGTYAKSFDVSFGVVPGIVAFATNNIAFEVSIGALGLSYSHVDLLQNQVYEGSVDSSNMSFKLNIFSVGLGVSFYL